MYDIPMSEGAWNYDPPVPIVWRLESIYHPTPSHNYSLIFYSMGQLGTTDIQRLRLFLHVNQLNMNAIHHS